MSVVVASRTPYLLILAGLAYCMVTFAIAIAFLYQSMPLMLSELVYQLNIDSTYITLTVTTYMMATLSILAHEAIIYDSRRDPFRGGGSIAVVAALCCLTLWGPTLILSLERQDFWMVAAITVHISSVYLVVRKMHIHGGYLYGRSDNPFQTRWVRWPVPHEISVERGRVVGFKTSYRYRCARCGKPLDKIRLSVDEVGTILTNALLTLSHVRHGEADADTVNSILSGEERNRLADELAECGIQLTQRETLTLSKMYTLEYVRRDNAAVLYVPPRCFEETMAVKAFTPRIHVKKHRRDKNNAVYLLGVEILLTRRGGYIVADASTCVFGVMSNGMPWLHQTPPYLGTENVERHLRWCMGITGRERIIEADRHHGQQSNF
ncbi:MAG: hypothetical protein QXD61_08910 [Candidatus Caldarchaeum sp.]